MGLGPGPEPDPSKSRDIRSSSASVRKKEEPSTMEKAYLIFAQSRFFTPAFNSAIYDGPLRIYFAQRHESAALKLYFSLVQECPEELKELKRKAKDGANENIYITIYPDDIAFKERFSSQQLFAVDKLEGHKVIGLCGPQDVADFAPIIREIKSSYPSFGPELQASL